MLLGETVSSSRAFQRLITRYEKKYFLTSSWHSGLLSFAKWPRVPLLLPFSVNRDSKWIVVKPLYILKLCLRIFIQTFRPYHGVPNSKFFDCKTCTFCKIAPFLSSQLHKSCTSNRKHWRCKYTLELVLFIPIKGFRFLLASAFKFSLHLVFLSKPIINHTDPNYSVPLVSSCTMTEANVFQLSMHLCVMKTHCEIEIVFHCVLGNIRTK